MKQFNLKEYLEHPDRNVVTRDGRKVNRVLCTDAKGVFPIVALVERCDATFGTVEEPITYTKGGEYYPGKEHICDLFFDTEKHKGYASICFSDGEYHLDDIIYSSEKEAEINAGKYGDFVTAVKIEWEE